MFQYKAYSLNINSEIEFPEFMPSEKQEFDVEIVLGKTPDQLVGENVVTKVRYQATKNEVLYLLKGAGKIYISKGTSIIVEPIENPDWEHLKNHVRSRAIAAILHQRKWAILHGSAIYKNGKAIIFIGRSGAGKSTFLGAFIKKGYDFISDDLCLIKKTKEGQILLFPAYPQVRLWENSIQLIETNEHLEKGPAVRSELDKYFMKPKTSFIKNPTPINNVYVLNATQNKVHSIQNLPPLEKLSQLLKFSFAKGHLEGLGGHIEQFELYSQLLKDTSIKTIDRPLGMKRESFWKMIEEVEHDFLNPV